MRWACVVLLFHVPSLYSIAKGRRISLIKIKKSAAPARYPENSGHGAPAFTGRCFNRSFEIAALRGYNERDSAGKGRCVKKPPKNARGAKNAKDSLLAAGVRVFALYGYEGASTRQLAKEAGVNISAIAYYFSGKEGLYNAVIAHITAEMRDILGVQLQIAQAAMGQEGGMTDEQCRDILHGFIRGMTGFLLSEKVSPHAARIFIREQTDPTAAFDTLYAQTIRPVHEMITRLVAQLAGLDFPGEAATLCAHAVMGQVFGFKTHYATIMARLGWKKCGPAEVEKVTAVVLRHTDSIVAGYRAGRRKDKKQKGAS
ncbi:MAG: DUF1956 domain-containing protein [Alphaproteobacteria bacterium]|nr:DUF1956 domain-containing protein [Alphaproteobacteria bacterium]